jgi:transposase
MAYRTGNRNQMCLLPQSIEEYVAADAPVRVYDAFVEALDFAKLGIEINPYKVGNSPYHPKAMLKLLVYGYSYGVRSSRKLEQETYNNLTFIWLMGGLKPDFKTIAEFRRTNKQALSEVLKQCARLCIKLDLIAGNILFVDGTKIRANASRDATHDKNWHEQQLVAVDQRIAQLLEQCEAQDSLEEGLGSFVKMDKELGKAEKLKQKIENALREIKATEKSKVNGTDPECAIMHSIQGSHASYNAQMVVDDKHRLILHTEPVSAPNDCNQFARQIDQANQLLKKPCEAACADAGYADTEELEKIDVQGITVIVPSQRQALREEESPFSKSHFTYDQEQDCYYCPEGKRLTYRSTYRKNGKCTYKIEKAGLCRSCSHFEQCTRSREGRKVVRLKNEAVKQRLEAQYQKPSSQEIYARRKASAEHPFGHIKRNLKVTAFLLRGLAGVRAELSVLATCFNMARMIRIFGASKLIPILKTVSI